MLKIGIRESQTQYGMRSEAKPHGPSGAAIPTKFLTTTPLTFQEACDFLRRILKFSMQMIYDIPDVICRQFYEAYAEAAGWKSLATGHALPQWEALKPEILEGWRVVASKGYELFAGKMSRGILPKRPIAMADQEAGKG